ncbi:MAG: 2-oxoacid:ferredoxin oxidoreductase subunit beta [Planctomycetes bacterium]|nr:2-oxoacid:ferredoxin oxidoreductase subunit beta [Planctomycetota bacterium]
MATTVTPKPPAEKKNRLGLTREAYTGGKSTLCSGCGHDSITAQIIQAFFETGVDPKNVVKVSGIGCSSKTPAYFLGQAHGINAVHGRMPSLATGANAANRKLKCIGVSGDGDTASIGLGQFCHLIRRNVEVIYIIENNGVYGLTKGQFSATADMGTAHKKGEINEMPPVDCCGLAVELGCGFVARSFSADFKQLKALLEAAIHHNGTAVLDVVSPCVTFNNHPASTKSYKYSKDHEIPLHDIDIIPHFEPQAEIHIEPGTTREVELYDGAKIVLKKLEEDYDPTNRAQATQSIERSRQAGQFLTGLIYLDTARRSYVDQLHLVDEPLANLPQSRLRPDPKALDEIMDSLK